MKYVFWMCAFLSLPATAHGQAADSAVGFKEVVSALEENNMSAEEIRTTDSYTRMDIVDLRAINDGAKVEALQEVLRDTEDQWAEVQTALKANQLFEQELSKRSIQTDRIIAATMDAAGVVAVYLR